MTAHSKPDVDLTDGNFFADGGAREAYRWMRANEPVSYTHLTLPTTPYV